MGCCLNNSCLSRKSDLRVQISANQASIDQCSEIISTFNDEISILLIMCEQDIKCATEKTKGAIKIKMNWDALDEYRTTFLNYKNKLEEEYNEAVRLKAELEEKNENLRNSLNSMGDCCMPCPVITKKDGNNI